MNPEIQTVAALKAWMEKTQSDAEGYVWRPLWTTYFFRLALLWGKGFPWVFGVALRLGTRPRWRRGGLVRWLRRRVVFETFTGHRVLCIGEFASYTFPLIRAACPPLILNDLVDVQPMTDSVWKGEFWHDRW